jgi:hypothetical protein
MSIKYVRFAAAAGVKTLTHLFTRLKKGMEYISQDKLCNGQDSNA